ncbi:MAG: hypothetical protein A2845_02225 [Candidatus Lloydbacteria bacterium RIFCSPHIGHO2_01_FULL_49_22]|uniref:Endolytic murein transglycosylase n=1 Tax=Candidatus Lloydbacteria bacterium RIFCSPHIGHO2_01_FULL_49_22 TaxID=1798658 RepID=A0A1G2CV32_9BACT|nr:MAG: hypothetical protein A2845_02225 [Candidatus Lloydbacteria bacterium RIFCSPHIGHO2_01_FULL_49_22]OGZ10269.1 MAG: hypothetical protein A3C14_01925 [Candidatus Lloydbacteria bacterium RIFCSPHIGHO2_02_FULL_50_18]
MIVTLEKKEEFENGGTAILPHLPEKRTHRLWKMVGVFIVLLCVITVAAAWFLALSPSAERKTVTVEIASGSGVRGIASLLHDEGIIRSPLLFTFLARYTKADTMLGSGVFQFQMPMDVFSVLTQVRLHRYGITRSKITIPEGTPLSIMAGLFSASLPNFDKSKFLDETEGMEGYLFPDTYFFFVNATSGPVIAVLSDNFIKKTAVLKSEAEITHGNWNEVIVMASLIEEEAVTDMDRKIISGILWARIARGMRLQVDAPFVYFLGKASSEITIDDLSYDSPWNTYRYKGLPPTPISNPGLLAIDAALHPTKTNYLFYLSDKEGVMHYAKTFEEHKLNKAKYLY